MTDVSLLGHLFCGVAAAGAGAVNAIAGGGTLLSFPAMTAVGVPAISANATNTVSLTPGYVGGTIAQRSDLTDRASELRTPLIVSALCGLAGSVLLVISSEAMFRSLVPFLILGSCVLLAVQVPLRSVLFGRSDRSTHPTVELAAVGLTSIYGGYFGAGLGIMLMAVLGLLSPHPLRTVNAIKQLLSISVNVSAAMFLAVSGTVGWTLVAVMAPCALLGGNLGGRLAGVIHAGVLRAAVVAYGTCVGVAYLL